MMGRGGFSVIPLLIIVAALAAVVGLALIVFNPGQKLPLLQDNENAVACTQEAKQCPDGSYVGRIGPNCEFAACPSTNATNTVNPTNVNQNVSRANINVGDIACTQDVLSCADGSYVTRQPPDCQFAKCPNGSQPGPLPY
jgi:hypothetical protein